MGAMAMVVLAQLRPQQLRAAAPWIYIVGIVLLVVVDVMGAIGKGAQRWLDLGFIRFQPSEVMKLAVPMLCAWYLHERPLPPTAPTLGVLAAHHPGAGRAHGSAAGPRHRHPDHHRRRAAGGHGRAVGVAT